ncbi:8252_t:CDS:2 [Paraglomus occultum]|uniref:8252_t:CDS:1 n=1 Tax=Paraglomus occultum TaxID=144539 RepID=A0A9N9CWP9_9GLOM|nr:8252_t:CDS:2 [Paraglomus occultum]
MPRSNADKQLELLDYFVQTSSDQWSELSFLSWLDENGKELLKGNRFIQDRWTRWHKRFLSTLDLFIARCKGLIDEAGGKDSTSFKSEMKSAVNLKKRGVNVFVSWKLQPTTPLWQVGLGAISLARCFRDMASPWWSAGYGISVVERRLGHTTACTLKMMSLEVTFEDMELNIFLFNIFNFQKKVPKAVRDWWRTLQSQKHERSLKQQEMQVMMEDSLAQVKWTAVRNEKTRKRFSEVDDSNFRPKRQKQSENRNKESDPSGSGGSITFDDKVDGTERSLESESESEVSELEHSEGSELEHSEGSELEQSIEVDITNISRQLERDLVAEVVSMEIFDYSVRYN